MDVSVVDSLWIATPFGQCGSGVEVTSGISLHVLPQTLPLEAHMGTFPLSLAPLHPVIYGKETRGLS